MSPPFGLPDTKSMRSHGERASSAGTQAWPLRRSAAVERCGCAAPYGYSTEEHCRPSPAGQRAGDLRAPPDKGRAMKRPNRLAAKLLAPMLLAATALIPAT